MTMRIRLMVAAGILGVMILAFSLPHGDPSAVDLTAVLQPPSQAHPLGTDDLGRDVWALMAVGFWRTLTVVVTASLTSVLIGVPLGLIAGYSRGAVNAIIMTATDLTMIIPTFVAALLVTAVVGLTPFSAGLVLGLFGAGTYVNQTRALTLSIRSYDYVRAEVLLATPTVQILLRHVLPGVAGPLMRYFGSSASGTILAYAGLAFIGLGVDTTVPDWGTMLYRHRSQIDHPLLLLWPTLGIFLLAIVFHILADPALRKEGQ